MMGAGPCHSRPRGAVNRINTWWNNQLHSATHCSFYFGAPEGPVSKAHHGCGLPALSRQAHPSADRHLRRKSNPQHDLSDILKIDLGYCRGVSVLQCNILAMIITSVERLSTLRFSEFLRTVGLSHTLRGKFLAVHLCYNRNRFFSFLMSGRTASLAS